ncbi:MAG: hypothetical protein ACQ9MH_08000 [Nitrospinales bacterium]
MSVYIKINGWYGSNKEDISLPLAKVFRLNREDANSAIDQISQGLPWQFDKSISEEQSNIAKDYLEKLGFEVELLPTYESTDPDPSKLYDSDQDYEDAFSDIPISEIQPKPKSSKTGIIVLLIFILGVVGLTQTQFGKDAINKITSQSKELVNGVGSEPEVIPDIPAPPPVQPMETEIPTAIPSNQPLQGIGFTGESSMEYPITLGGCHGTEDQHNLILLKSDLDQTQNDFFCKGNTIANPKSAWKCEFKPNSKICPSKETYSCVREYQCIPETQEYNRAKYKQELENLS